MPRADPGIQSRCKKRPASDWKEPVLLHKLNKEVTMILSAIARGIPLGAVARGILLFNGPSQPEVAKNRGRA